MTVAKRAPIGFVVEGRGEKAAYPSLVSRITGDNHSNFPIVVAGGYGSVLKNIEEHIDDLVMAHHPYTVIVTIDLRDVIQDNQFSSCCDLRKQIETELQSWTEKAKANNRLLPLPERLVIIIQIQLFESWWLSDPDNLCSTKHVNLNNVPSWGNVDDEVPNPIKWFKKHSSSKSKLKSPIIAKKIISELDPESMRDNSRSFDKFYREISLSHKKWLKCVTSNS